MQTRLDIILETVSEILEDAERARSRRELRKSEAEDAGKRITSELARVGPGGVAKYDLDRLGMVIKGSAQRIAAAAELMKARQQHGGTDDAQKILDVDSYKFGISPPERKARYKARKKSGKGKKKRYPEKDPYGGVRRVRPGHGDLEQG